MFRSTNLLSTVGISAVVLAAAACNQPPPAPSVSITPDVPTTLDDLMATYDDVEDPNGADTVSYSFAWELLPAGAPDSEDAWESMPELTGSTVGAELTEKGQSWRVTVTATDGVEVATSETSAVVAVANSLPEIVSVRLSPAEGVDTFGVLTASASATDIDGDDVTIDYTWLVNGTPIAAEGTVLTGDYFGKGDVVTVEATPVDGEASGEAVSSNGVTIMNTPPKIEGVVISPDEILEGTEVVCDAIGWYDADDDAPNVSATWLVNGEEIAGVTGNLTGEYFNKGDLIRCMGAPDDGDSLGDMVVSEVVQVGNTGPTLGSVTLSNTAPKAADTLSYTPVDAVDVDGDEITFNVEWYVEGEMVATGQELPTGNFVKGQEIYAMVTPYDGLVAGDPVKSDLATAVNSPPQIIEISMAPGELYTGSAAFPGVTAVDPDGDPVTYTQVWKVNGSTVAETGPVLDGEVWFDKEDEIQVELTPNDGEDDGATLASDVYTILNSPPTTPAVAVDPELPTPDDDLWCEVVSTSTDADGDTLEYEITWTQNGTEFTGADTLDEDYEGDYVYSDDTEDGDTWTCTLSVTDGTDTATAVASVETLSWRGPRNFNTCGAAGYRGPTQSQCDSEYEDSPISGDGLTIVDNGWQEWTAPQDGTFRITAYGAAGGNGSTTFGSNEGHKGAMVRGDFDLEEGDKLLILVGQAGTTGSTYSAGGGGASWIMDEDGTVLMTAGGGGGNGYRYYYYSSCGGQSGSNPSRMTGTWSSSGCSTHFTTTGSGGEHQYRSVGTLYYYGGGGAGYSGDGTYFGSTCYSRAEAVTDSVNPGRGADGRWGDGGFGGGGCGGYSYKYSWSSSVYTSSFYGSGGGGGYTGGGGGYYRAGGGSSYNTGSNKSSASNNNSGDGSVMIDLAP